MIDPKYLDHLIEIRAVTTDVTGEQVLVGLTASETAEYFHLVEHKQGGSHEAADRYLELHDRHERARFQVLAAENQLRVDKPTRN